MLYNISANFYNQIIPSEGCDISWDSANINPNLSKLSGMEFGTVVGTFGQIVGLLVYASCDYFRVIGELTKKQYDILCEYGNKFTNKQNFAEYDPNFVIKHLLFDKNEIPHHTKHISWQYDDINPTIIGLSGRSFESATGTYKQLCYLNKYCNIRILYVKDFITDEQKRKLQKN